MDITNDRIVMRKWDNMHFHARQGHLRMEVIRHLLPYCARAIIMPNEDPPLTEAPLVVMSKVQLMNCAHHLMYPNFTPLMTLYVTEETTTEMIDAAFESGTRHVKVYPKDVTTGSKYGVSNYSKILPVLKRCGELGIIVLLHGEHPGHDVEGIEKERKFLAILEMLLDHCGGKFVLEHVSSEFGIGYILNRWDGTDNRLAGTITPHHLIHTHDDLAGYGPASGYKAQPILSCKPCIKFRRDREAVERAALSGALCFFYGGDDAAHPDGKRGLIDCACGVWNTIAAPSVLIEFFLEHGELQKLEDFTSRFGAEFYGLPLNKEQIVFAREEWKVPEKVHVPSTDDLLTPWMAGKTMKWKQLIS